MISQEQSAALLRYRLFVQRLRLICWCYAVVYAGVALAWRDASTLGGATVVGLYGVLLLAVERRALARGRLDDSVAATAYGLLVAALALVVVQPSLLIDAVVVPLLAGAGALSWQRADQMRRLLVACWLTVVVVATIGMVWTVPTAAPPLALAVVRTSALAFTAGLILWRIGLFHARQLGALADTRQALEELARTHAALDEQQRQVQQALDALRVQHQQQIELHAQVVAQQQVIQALSVPVLPVRDGTLVVPLIGALDSARLELLQEVLLAAVERAHARLVVLDVTGVPLIDTQVAQGLSGAVRAVRLLGAEVVLVGVRPEVAQALVSLGAELPVDVAGDLAAALAVRRRAA